MSKLFAGAAGVAFVFVSAAQAAPVSPPQVPALDLTAARDGGVDGQAGLLALAPLVMVQRPTFADLARVYPRAARRARVGGSATVRCRVQPDGTVTDCLIVAESPDGQGFGPAAIAVTRAIRYAPIANARDVTLPIRFVSVQ